MGVRLHVRSLWASRSEDEVVYEFDQDRILIGRGRGADVRLPNRAVSVRHASIEAAASRYTIVDHASTNGTRVCDARLVPDRQKPLRDGDRIEIGGFSIVFRSGVAVSQSTSSERTSSLARRLLREVLRNQEEDLRPALVVQNGPEQGRRVLVPDPPAHLVVGRGEHCEIVLDDSEASREHAEIDVAFEGVRVRDLGSKNGILVGGRPMRERVLDDRDELRIGATVLLFDDPAGARIRELEAGDDDALEPPTFAELTASEPVAEPDPIEAPPPAPAPARRREPTSIAPADMVIYVLASIVFAVSVLGLVWLLRS